MIPKGMKVGDTFEDGGVLHEVLAVDGANYVSRVIDGEITIKPKAVEVKETPKEEEKLDYLSLPYAQLKKLCADRGLDATGKKSDLIARLEG